MDFRFRPDKHYKARCETYPRFPEVVKFPVPEDKMTWDVMYEEYNPPDFTAPSVQKGPVWADPDFKTNPVLGKAGPKWNCMDGKIDRRSHAGKYNLVNGIPRNYVGRTGVCSRGLLGRWGPNHAADPIVTRWKRDNTGAKLKHSETKKPILQFIAIQRSDTGEWAIPGGLQKTYANMLNADLRSALCDETLACQDVKYSERKIIMRQVYLLFKYEGKEVYRGYVDDPRNTDNAWMETVAVNFHDENGDSVAKFNLHAGDDAVGVRWVDLHSEMQLYASHTEFCHRVVKLRNAHW